MRRGELTIAAGVHSAALQKQIVDHWNNPADHLLVLVSSHFKDFSKFEPALSADVEFPKRPIFALPTSGTLGPKLIFYSRENITASLEGILSFFELEKIDSVFCYPQPVHVFGLVLGYLFPALYGKRLEFAEGPYSTLAHDAWLSRVGPGTLTLGTPTHIRDLVSRVRTLGVTPPASYSCIVGGAAVPRALWLEAREVLRIEKPSIGYGASELSPGASHLPPGREPLGDGEIGVPLPNVDLAIQPGMGIKAKGANVCLAVAQSGELHFPEEIWLRDEVTAREDGTMVFSHRTDLILNRGGEKVSFEQIESLLWTKHGLVAVGVGVEHPRLGQELALIVEANAANPVSREAVYKTLQDAHAREFDSRLFFVVPELPRNANSKIDRKACLKHAELQCSFL